MPHRTDVGAMPSGSALPPAVAAKLGAAAQRMQNGFEPMMREALQAIFDAAPGMADDPVLAEQTRSSTTANVRRWVTATVARPEVPVGFDAPPEALDLARDVVRRGLGHDDLLTAYRKGQNVCWRTFMRCAEAETDDAADLVAVLEAGSSSLFSYVDGVLDVLGRMMAEEREAVAGGALTRRRQTVELLLDGAPLDITRASSQIAYDLRQPHLGAHLWATDGDPAPGSLERAAAELGSLLGAGRPLLVPAGTRALRAWLGSPALDGLRHIDANRRRALASVLPPGVRVVFGGLRVGLTGFRRTHDEAVDAQRIAMSRTTGDRVLTHAEIATVVLAAQDRSRASRFVTDTLGELRTADDGLRETVRVFLREDQSASRSAKVLHTHRNTVLRRVARASSLLPLPLEGQALEVHLALELEQWVDA